MNYKFNLNYHMNNIYVRLIALGFILICSVISIGQVQVSHVENLMTDDEHPRKGFIKVDTIEYYIEQGLTGTKVWQIENGALHFLHELKLRPTDSKIDLLGGDTYENNSNLIYDGHTLFEFYHDYIYLVDFVKGEVLEIIDLRNYGYKFPSQFQFGKNFMYFHVGSSSLWRGTIRYDRNTKRLEVLKFSGSYFNSKLYDHNQDGFIYLDLETNKTHQIKHNVYDKFGFLDVDNDPNINFVFQDSFYVYRLLKDDSIDTLDCKIPRGNQILYYCNQRMIYGSVEDNMFNYYITDLNMCQVVFSESLQTSTENSYIRFEDTRNLYGEYILIRDYQIPSKAVNYIYDIKSNKKTELIISGFPDFNYNSLKVNNNLYFASNNVINLHRDRTADLYKLDLKTGLNTLLLKSDSLTPSNILLSDVGDRDYVNVCYQYEGGSSVFQIDENNEKIKEIYKNSALKNVGIFKYTITDLWVDDKYFIATSEAVFMISETISRKIVDLPKDIIRMSELYNKNDRLYLLCEKLDTSFVLKINTFDLTYYKINLPTKFIMGEMKFIEDDLIVNYSSQTFRNATHGFFDLNSDQFISASNLNVQSGSIIDVSGANILYRLNQNNKLHLFDPILGKLIPLDFVPNFALGVIPDTKGGFYLNVNKKLCHLDSSGKLTILLDNFEYPYFKSGNFTDKQQSFAFYNDKELVIVIVKNGEVRKKVRKIDSSFNHYSFFWHESETISFFEFYVSNQRNLYYYSFDSEPRIVSVRYWNQNTLFVMQNKDHAVFAYRVNGFIYNFDKFDFKTLKVTSTLEFSPGFSYMYKPTIQLNEKEYLISFDDGTHGTEPWVYNIETHSFTILADMRSGFLPSSPSDYHRHPKTGDIYFLATRSEGDRQLFKIKNDLTSTEHTHNQNAVDFSIYPVPSSNFLILDRNFKHVKVVGIKGNIILTMNNYNKGDGIDISNISNGLYFLSCSNDAQHFKTKTFVISR